MASVKLRIGHADGRVEERELGPGSYRIGREQAEIVLSDATVSAHHAQLEVTGGRVVLRDAGSRNGSFDPAGQRIAGPYTLRPEQPVRLGAVSLTLSRSLGEAGGTRAMPHAPAPGATAAAAILAETGPPFAPPLVASDGTRAPPGTSRWLQWLGVGVMLLLGLASLKTCTTLVQVLSERTPRESPSNESPSSKSPSSPAPSQRPSSKGASKHPPGKASE